MKRTTVFLDQGEFMGGAEHFLLDFLGALSPTERRRLNPVILGGQSAEYQARLEEEIQRIDFTLPPVKGAPLAKLKALWQLLWAARRLKQQLKTLGATQLFTNTPRAHLTALLLRRVWGWRGSWIVMVHDFTMRPAWVVQRLGAQADWVIANSMPTRQWLRQHLKKPDHEKIRLIENGVIPAAAVEPVTSLTTVLNLGRIDPRKGQRLFLEAADLLHERNPDLHFTITGDSVAGDPATRLYETELKGFVRDRQLENLILKPSVKDPLAEIQQYDALVFTPTEPETFGRVVIEALSRGKLVLAFAQTGPKEILEEYQRWLGKKYLKNPPEKGELKGVCVQGKTPSGSPFSGGGVNTENSPLLVEPNNAMSLAEAIAYFADNPSQVEKYTAHAAEFVAQNYSLNETKKRLVEVLLG